MFPALRTKAKHSFPSLPNSHPPKAACFTVRINSGPDELLSPSLRLQRDPEENYILNLGKTMKQLPFS